MAAVAGCSDPEMFAVQVGDDGLRTHSRSVSRKETAARRKNRAVIRFAVLDPDGLSDPPARPRRGRDLDPKLFVVVLTGRFVDPRVVAVSPLSIHCLDFDRSVLDDNRRLVLRGP